MSSLRAYACVASTLHELPSDLRAKQLAAAATIARHSLETFLKATDTELSNQMVLPFVMRRDSEASWSSVSSAHSVGRTVAFKAKYDNVVRRDSAEVLATPRKKETTLVDLDPWLVEASIATNPCIASSAQADIFFSELGCSGRPISVQETIQRTSGFACVTGLSLDLR